MFFPSEYNPPLVVDPDRVATRQITLQGFEPVSGGNREVLEHSCPVHLNQFAQCHPRDGAEALVGFPLEKLLSVLVCEGLDHGLEIGSEASRSPAAKASPDYEIQAAEQDAAVIDRIAAAQRAEVEEEIAGLKVERVAGEAEELVGEVPF